MLGWVMATSSFILDGTASFVRGTLFGILLTLLLETAAVLYLLKALADPHHRFTNASAGDRSSKDLVPEQGPTLVSNIPKSGSNGIAASTSVNSTGSAVSNSDTVPEHLRPWPAAIVAFLSKELTPQLNDWPLADGKPVHKATFDAIQFLHSSASASTSTSAKPIPSSTSATCVTTGSTIKPNLELSAGHDATGTSTAANTTLSAEPSHQPVTHTIASISHETDPVAVGELEHCHWLNVILHRFFLTFRGSVLFKKRWTERMSQKLNMKLKNNTFVSAIQIKELSLGDNSPEISGIRLLKGVTKDLAVIGEADVSYNGGGSILLEVVLTAGITIPARVFLNQFTGSIRVRTPSVLWPDMIGVTFVEDPGISFTVDTGTGRINEFLRSMINKAVASIVRKTFLELWVLPSWRTFFLPQMQPSAEEYNEMSRLKAEAAFNQGGKDSFGQPLQPSKHTLAGRATALWESRILRGSKLQHKDMLQGSTFNTTLALTPVCHLQPEDMEESLSELFLKFVQESATATASALPATADIAVSKKSEEGSISSNSISNLAMGNNASTNNVLDVSQEHAKPHLPLALSALTQSTSNPGLSSLLPLASQQSTAPTQQPVFEWKTIRNRLGVHIQKRLEPDSVYADMIRAFITIECDPDRVGRVLCNPEHFGHIYDSFESARFVHEFGNNRTIMLSKFKFGRSITKSLLLFCCRRILPCSTDIPEEAEMAMLNDSLTSLPLASDASTENDEPIKKPPQKLIFIMRSIKSFNFSEPQKYESTVSDPKKISRVYSTSDLSLSAAASQTDLNGLNSSTVTGFGSDTVEQNEHENDGLNAQSETPKLDSKSLKHRRRSQSFNIDTSKTLPVDSSAIQHKTPRHVNSLASISVKNISLEIPLSTNRVADLSSASLTTTPKPVDEKTVSETTPTKIAAEVKARSDVYLYGYLIEPCPDNPNHSKVTVISHMSPELQRLDMDFNTCRKLKLFIEELDQFTRGTHPSSLKNTDAGNEINRRRLFPFGGSSEPNDPSLLSADGRRIDKIKNYLGSTASYLMKGRKGLNAIWSASRSAARDHDSGEEFDGDDMALSGELHLPTASSNENFKHDMDNYFDEVESEADYLHKPSNNEVPGDQGRPTTDSKPSSLRQPKSLSALWLNSQQRSISAPEPSSELLSGNSCSGNVDFTIIAPRRSLAHELSEFGREPYVERVLYAKEAVRVEIQYDRSKFGPAVVFEWEYMMRVESTAYFSIIYVPNTFESGTYPIINLLPVSHAPATGFSLFPTASVQSYIGPAYGTSNISSLASGMFVLSWEGPGTQLKKQLRSFAYKCLIHNLDISPDDTISTIGPANKYRSSTIRTGTCVEIVIPRKSFFSLPLLYDDRLVHSGIDVTMMHTTLEWEFTTGGYDITFAIYFDPISTSEKKDPPGLDEKKSTVGITHDFALKTIVEDNAAFSGPVVHSSTASNTTTDAIEAANSTESGKHQTAVATHRLNVLEIESESNPRRSLSDRLAAAVGRDGLLVSDQHTPPAGSNQSSTTSSPLLTATHTTQSDSVTSMALSSAKSTMASIIASRLVTASRSNATQRDVASGGNGPRMAFQPHTNAEFNSSGSPHRVCLVQPVRVNSSRGHTFGSMDVTGKYGVYTLLWDNSTSLVTSRTVGVKTHLVTIGSVDAEENSNEG
ncbi:hypothetical protein BATDEDRAFT_35067 [Batrachochytrium dendrobatidis JAM81]|uniref:SMP-LTD domain-containing protein n=1 Tax=Batrachochytrium dendrobatidis (strain JAM81 / FGSC 10211) TaxID=684364 RepID=F4P399_BATDJ|nr:uncharacterized protein BATDEDRAFT_35067 [Batrachochytrium dendrobatidis JAM81]EGF80365.1 hypothetical protein BATDEDRAFT_35067 [Batrachochytrium dendrobatidis JAM81]|eukprot:XP_006679097.1 hypothetical protein BATDEDRAFT_35067 [Batrachochytrium dendrobatidis JAM81]